MITPRRFFLFLTACVLSFSTFGWSTLFEEEVTGLTKKEAALIQHVKDSLRLAEKEDSKLNCQVLNVPGKTSLKVKHLLNNLCSIPGMNYLEVGGGTGATLIAALSRNEAQTNGVVIDYLMENGRDRTVFTSNIQHFLPTAHLKQIERDSYIVEKKLDPDCFVEEKQKYFEHPISVYFYDPSHSGMSHEMAFTCFDNVFDSTFALVVDDWNWIQVQDGVFAAFEKLGYKVLFQRVYRTGSASDTASWWNGLYVAVVKK